MLHPLLPKLRGDDRNQIAGFNQPGRWDDREVEELSKLSNSIKVEEINPNYLEIDSIPDMWARPLLFEMALFDGEHLLHPRMLAEWRGLLALIALKHYRRIDKLSTMAVELPNVRQIREQRGTVGTDLLSVLAQLAPQAGDADRALAANVDWLHHWVFLFGDRAIGMTSPTTLVCTAIDYRSTISNVAWFDGRLLGDPVSLLNKTESRALANWLNTLSINLTADPQIRADNPQLNVLLELLDNYITDLGGARGATIDYDAPILVESGRHSGIFEYLSRPVRPPDVPESEVSLVPSRQGAPTVKLLVLDESIATKWKREKQNILVWGIISLETAIPFSGLPASAARDMIAGQSLTEAKWRTPEDFLTDRLFVLKRKDAFPGALHVANDTILTDRNEDLVSPLLPVREELLDYLTAADLRRRIRFEKNSLGITVALRLPLAGGDFEVSRLYHFKDNQIIYLDDTPVLEVWPNFRREGWRLYFTYFSTGGQRSTFRARPYVAPGVELGRRVFDDREISRTTAYPEAMVCQADVADTQYETFKTEAAGVLLLTPPERKTNEGKHWHIGIDFGTTGTHAFRRQEGAAPGPIVLQQRLVSITQTREVLRLAMFDHFLPPEEQETPFLSIFQAFPNAPEPTRLRPTLDGHIFFIQETVEAAAKRVTTDLKWSRRERERIYTGTFLEQICLQCAAEAAEAGVSEIVWSYSFPTAFSEKQQDSFRAKWIQVTRQCKALTGLGGVVTGQKKTPAEPRAMTESEASASFFREVHKAPTATGTVFIDIGGGTSDIAIWQHNRVCWQTSLLYAGRTLFLDPLYENTALLKRFVGDIQALEKAKMGEKTAFYAEVDALLNRKSNDILAKLVDVEVYADVQRFRQLIALGLSGLFYYVGLVLRHLIEAGRYEREVPDIYVGGNGSKMFRWLGAGEFRSDNPLKKLFKRLVMEAVGFEDQARMIELELSKHPKGEAAFGLVSKVSLVRPGAAVRDNRVVAGEPFGHNRQVHPWNTLVDAEILQQGITAQRQLVHLPRLINIFNNFAASQADMLTSIDNTNDVAHKLYQQLAVKLVAYKRFERRDIIVEPLFMLAMKTLLEVEAHLDKWPAETI